MFMVLRVATVLPWAPYVVTSRPSQSGLRPSSRSARWYGRHLPVYRDGTFTRSTGRGGSIDVVRRSLDDC